MRNRETGTGPAIVTPLDEEIAFASEDLDCGGAQRLVVTAVDFTRFSRRSFADLASSLPQHLEPRPRSSLHSPGDEEFQPASPREGPV